MIFVNLEAERSWVCWDVSCFRGMKRREETLTLNVFSGSEIWTLRTWGRGGECQSVHG